jgi:murein DD-endopeptidase MepM/ murein hydrolase activator NlpD
MLELIRILFGLKDRSIQVIIVDPEDTSNPKEVVFTDKQLSKSFLVLFSVSGVVLFLLISLIIMRWTAGGDARIRTELNSMTVRVNALSDSLIARDDQLNQIKELLQSTSSLSSTENTVKSSSNLIEAEVSVEQTQTQGIVFPEEWDKMGRMVGIRPGLRPSRKDAITKDLFPAQLPVIGSVTRTYLPEIGHIGLDIALREGTPVRSFAAGAVISAEWTLSYGYVVSILHEQNVLVMYKHLKDTRVISGERIQKGEEIGLVGNVGYSSSGPHLHLEVWKDGTHVDPMLYFVLN